MAKAAKESLKIGQERARQQAVDGLRERTEGIPFGMLTSGDEQGLDSQPVAAATQELDGVLWFFSALSSRTMDQIQRRPEINVSYAKPDQMRYVSVSGTAEVSRDPKKMRELWKDIYKGCFARGLEDPDLCLVKVQVTSAAYWDVRSGKMSQLAGFSKASARGEAVDDQNVERPEVERTKAASLSGPSEDASDEIESHT
jgi:general stress protein 26